MMRHAAIILARMDATLKRLLALSSDKDVELACAAVKVLGILAPKEPEVAKSLTRLLAGANLTLVHYALSALAESAGPEILEPVAGHLAAPPPLGPAARGFVERHLAAARGILTRIISGKDAAVARAALALLAKLPPKELDPAALLPALKSPDEETIRDATEILRARVGDLPKDRLAAFLKKLSAFARTKEARSSPATLTACVKLLGAAGPEGDLATLLAYTEEGNPTRVRKNAFYALAKQEIPKRETARAAKAALAALAPTADPDVSESAGELLKKLPPDKTWAKGLAAALAGGGPGRAQAIAAAARLPAGPAVDLLFPLLGAREPDTRHATARALSRVPGAAPLLLKHVDRKLPNEAAWGVAEALRLARETAGAADRKALRDRLLALLAKDDPSAEVLVDAAREIAPDVAGPALLAAALKEKDPARRTEGLKRTLRVWPDAPEARLALALADIRKNSRDLSPQARGADRGLSTLAGAAKADPKGTAAALAKEKGLSAQDLYYVGFHFAERTGPEGEFGTLVLKAFLKRFPKDDRAEAARNKLRISK